VAVVDTNQFRVITQSVKKTDANDAQLLALYLAKGLLPEVRLKDKQHGQVASLTQTRDTLVKLRTALKNKVNNILSARGINLAKETLSSEKKLDEVLALPFEELTRIELRVIIGQIRSLNQSIRELDQTIAEEGSKLDGHKNLTSIKGIGKITGAILLSVIGDVNDFPDEHRLASYFGIVPRVSNSNETERSGRIHKRGSKLGRTALIQSALIAARYSPYLRKFFERVKDRRGAGKAHHCVGPEISGDHLSDAQKQVGLRGFSQFRSGGGRMTRSGLSFQEPGLSLIPASAARQTMANSRTVLGVKGPLRRGPLRRALDSCAPFCRVRTRDGRLRRESETAPVLRL
jgi:transposase